MSPRKSSTSSARPVDRPRYLGVEVVGEPFVPRAWFESTLVQALAPTGRDRRIRVIRVDRSRALVEVGHRWALEARRAWSGKLAGPGGRLVELATRRTWGTLRGGKVWLRDEVPAGRKRFAPARR